MPHARQNMAVWNINMHFHCLMYVFAGLPHNWLLLSESREYSIFMFFWILVNSMLKGEAICACFIHCLVYFLRKKCCFFTILKIKCLILLPAFVQMLPVLMATILIYITEKFITLCICVFSRESVLFDWINFLASSLASASIHGLNKSENPNANTHLYG